MAFIVGAALSVAFVLCLAAAQNRPLAAVWMALIGACAAREAWRRHTARNGEPLAQVKLAPQGFHQGCRQLGSLPFERSDSARFEAWDSRLTVRITPLDAGRAQIVIVQPAEGPPSLDRTLINADVAIDRRQVNAIRDRIACWTAAHATRCVARRADAGPTLVSPTSGPAKGDERFGSTLT